MKISIIIPAFNEERNLEQAVKGLCLLLNKNGMMNDCEILIFNDKSTDKTGEIADSLAKEISNVKVIHNKKNMGLGYNFREGVRLAIGEYVTWFPGDNENLPESFVDTLSYAGKNEVIIPFTANQEIRPFLRRMISCLYTALNNFLFSLNLRYYNGLCIYKRDLLANLLPSISNGFAFSAEILVILLKSGASYIEVPTKIREKTSSKTSAFRFKNIISVIKTITLLFWRVNIKKNYPQPRVFFLD